MIDLISGGSGVAEYPSELFIDSVNLRVDLVTVIEQFNCVVQNAYKINLPLINHKKVISAQSNIKNQTNDE